MLVAEAGRKRFPYQEVLVVDAKALPEVPEHQGAVLLELEMTRHVLPAGQRRQNKTAGETLQHNQLLVGARRRFEGNSLVEEVVVHFDLGVGLEVIGHEHDGDLDVAELVYLGRGDTSVERPTQRTSPLDAISQGTRALRRRREGGGLLLSCAGVQNLQRRRFYLRQKSQPEQKAPVNEIRSKATQNKPHSPSSSS